MFPDFTIEHMLWVTSDVIQGGPLGPLFFALGQQPVLDSLMALNPLYGVWYLDDGVLIASEDWLALHWESITSAYRQVNLEINSKKCLLFGGPGIPQAHHHIALPRRAVLEGFVLLRSPLGSASFITKILQDHCTQLSRTFDLVLASVVLGSMQDTPLVANTLPQTNYSFLSKGP